MVKSQFLPATWRMALVTLLAIATTMDIIYLVAGNAVFRGLGIPVAVVAAGATCLFVFAREGERALFMLVVVL